MTEIVDNQKQAIGGRLKEARATLKLTQKELCAQTGLPLPSLRDYELCKRIPGGEAVAALIRAGISANWLLTGEGPMRLADLVAAEPAPPAPAKINIDALVQAVSVALQTAPKGDSPQQSIRKGIAFYQYCLEQGLVTETGVGEGILKNSA